MANIYEQYEKAFAHVAVYVVVLDARPVATVAFIFPRDGAGRLYAYVHWRGIEMVRGYASGYGYDKASAACSVAAHKLPADLSTDCYADGTPHHSLAERTNYRRFRAALVPDDGYAWDRRLRDAGFDVWQAV